MNQLAFYLFIYSLLWSCSHKPQAQSRGKEFYHEEVLTMVEDKKQAMANLQKITFKNMSDKEVALILNQLDWLRYVDVYEVLPDDELLTLVESIKLAKNKSFQDLLFSQIKEINLANRCQNNEVACTFKNEAGVVYLTKNFFNLSKANKVSTLLHEAYHLKFEGRDHIACKHQDFKNHTCDQAMASPYGVEVAFLTSALNNCHCQGTSLYHSLKAELKSAKLRVHSLL